MNSINPFKQPWKAQYGEPSMCHSATFSETWNWRIGSERQVKLLFYWFYKAGQEKHARKMGPSRELWHSLFNVLAIFGLNRTSGVIRPISGCVLVPLMRSGTRTTYVMVA